MKVFNVLTKKEFNDGQKPVTLWHKVGIIKASNQGRWYLQLFHLPNVDYYVLDAEQKDTNAVVEE